MTLIDEKILIDYPLPVFIDKAEIILNQMENNAVAQICCNNGSKGTGFFCEIPLDNNNEETLPAFITANHVIDENYLKNEKQILIKINNGKKIDIKYISLKDKFKYTNKKYDVTIIEIDKKLDKINEFLEFDENILNDTKGYIGNSIYTLHFLSPIEERKIAVSYGIIKNNFKKKENDFIHYCSTENGSSGAPILNLYNNKIIGIHKQASKEEQFNIGSFLYYSLNEFINKYKQKEYIYNLKTDNEKFYQLYLKLYNKGFVSDIIEIKKRFVRSIAYKLICSNKKKPEDWKNWISAWHGTNSSNLESIVENGLKIPGTKIKDKTIIKNKNYIALKDNVFGIKNWDNAIFASKNIHYALTYSDNYGREEDIGESWKALVEVRIKPGGFTSHKSKFIIEYYIGHGLVDEIDDEDDIYRISSEKNIIVTSITLISKFHYMLHIDDKKIIDFIE